MFTSLQLKKQQVRLCISNYLFDEIDKIRRLYSIYHTSILIEAIKSYVSEQKLFIGYNKFKTSNV